VDITSEESKPLNIQILLSKSKIFIHLRVSLSGLSFASVLSLHVGTTEFWCLFWNNRAFRCDLLMQLPLDFDFDSAGLLWVEIIPYCMQFFLSFATVWLVGVPRPACGCEISWMRKTTQAGVPITKTQRKHRSISAPFSSPNVLWLQDNKHQIRERKAEGDGGRTHQWWGRGALCLPSLDRKPKKC